MKIIFSFPLLFIAGAATAAIHPVADITSTGSTKQHELTKMNVDPFIHRHLKGCQDAFVCPEHSERKRGRQW